MFKKLLHFIKGVIKKMFNKSTITEATKIDIAVSSEMSQAIDLWEKMYFNKAPWLKPEEVESLNLPASIANEFARLTILELKSEITGSTRANYINDIYKEKILKKLGNELEKGNALGGLVFKPYVKNNKICIDMVSANQFYPTEFNSNDDVIGGIFISQITKGDNIYTRLEYHRFIENTSEYIIKNMAFVSNTINDLGEKVSLSSIEEWADIQEETKIINIEKPLFSYYKPPIANNIDDKSPLGVSVYSRATDLIKEADRQYGRIIWEYEASEKAIFVDELAIKPKNNNSEKQFSINKLKDRLYRKLDTGLEKNDFFEDYSPDIRDEAFWRGLNKILQRIEFNVGLAYGTLSEPNTVDKTATEIKSSKQRSYATVAKMQENLQTALEGLIYAIDVLITLYNLAPEGKYETSFEWDDSLIVDTEREQTLQMQEVSVGLRRKVKYIMFRYGLTEEQALEELELIKQEQMSNQEAMGILEE